MPDYLMPTYQLANCCWCLSLKTGCRIIGGLTAFVCSLELIINCNKLIEVLEREKTCLDRTDSFKTWEDPYLPYFISCSYTKIVQFRLIIEFIIFVIGFNGSILLIYGIKSKQPKLFLAWMIFSGMVIVSQIFCILIWHNMSIVTNVLIVIVLSYCFKVVRSYHLRLHEEINGGCPVLAVAFPQESDMRVFMPSHQVQYIKDGPPPPYPGLHLVSSSHSIDSQPPPYSLVNPNYEGPPMQNEPSTSTASPQANGLQRQCSSSETLEDISGYFSQNEFDTQASSWRIPGGTLRISKFGFLELSPSNSDSEENSTPNQEPETFLDLPWRPSESGLLGKLDLPAQTVNSTQTDDEESIKSVPQVANRSHNFFNFFYYLYSRK